MFIILMSNVIFMSNFFFVAFLFVCRVDWFLFVVVCFVLLLGVFCFLFCFFPGWEIREGQYWKQGKFGTDHDILAKMLWSCCGLCTITNDEQYKHQEVQQFKSAKSSVNHVDYVNFVC